MKTFATLTVFTLTSFSVVVACGDDDADGDGDAGAPSAAGRAATAGAPNDGGAHHAGGTGHGGGEHGPGSAECEVIGQLCHAADTNDGGPADQCHDTGHIGNAADCAEAFAGCIETCVEDAASSSPHCAALTALCAGAAEGSGAAHDCYHVGEAGDAEACEAELETCAEPCSEVFGHGSNMGGGAHGGMGHGGAGSEHVHGGSEHGGAGGSG